MIETSIETIVTFFRNKLAANGLNVAKIVLFGSYANGKAGDKSDLDLVIVSDDFQGKSIFERVALIGDSRAAVVQTYRIPVDILLMTTDELKNEISPAAEECRNGIVIYAA